jgi:ATP-dependent 26S proteasome regulatory subunit
MSDDDGENNPLETPNVKGIDEIDVENKDFSLDDVETINEWHDDLTLDPEADADETVTAILSEYRKQRNRVDDLEKYRNDVSGIPLRAAVVKDFLGPDDMPEQQDDTDGWDVLFDEDTYRIKIRPDGDTTNPILVEVSEELYDFLGENDVVAVKDDDLGDVVGPLKSADELAAEMADEYAQDPDEIDITTDDIGGYDQQVEQITAAFDIKEESPELFDMLDMSPGILMYGPPGTGKTYSAKAIAKETDRTLLTVKGPELLEKWVGNSEANVRNLFDAADKNDPSLIVIDEADGLLTHRGNDNSPVNVVNQFLAEMDGIEDQGDVAVVLTTNRADMIDPAVLRPSRIGTHVEYGPPHAYEDAGRYIDEICGQHIPGDASYRVASTIKENYLDRFVPDDVTDITEQAVINYVREESPDWISDSDLSYDDLEQVPDHYFTEATHGLMHIKQPIRWETQQQHDEEYTAETRDPGGAVGFQ